MKNLLAEIRNCTICISYLINGVNPVLSANRDSKFAIIGQAPGNIVHRTGIPWDDKSGDRLREWLKVDKVVLPHPSPRYISGSRKIPGLLMNYYHSLEKW
jgi:uracil-DNA glycosylase